MSVLFIVGSVRIGEDHRFYNVADDLWDNWSELQAVAECSKREEPDGKNYLNFLFKDPANTNPYTFFADLMSRCGENVSTYIDSRGPNRRLVTKDCWISFKGRDGKIITDGGAPSSQEKVESDFTHLAWTDFNGTQFVKSYVSAKHAETVLQALLA